MGIEPKPITPGNNCLLCFPAGETPDYVKVFFGDIKRGDLWLPSWGMPPNGYWDYNQSLTVPCTFATNIPGVQGSLHWTATGALLLFSVNPGIGVFSGNDPANCQRYFTNTYTNPATSIFYGGFGFVCTPQEMAEWIALATPVTGPDPRMELFPGDNGIIDIRFANKQDGTNFYLQLDSSLL